MGKITQKQKRSTKAIAAVVLTLIYSINVQSVQTETRHIARNDELYSECGASNESIRSL